MYLRQTIAVASRHAARPTPSHVVIARRSIFGFGKSKSKPKEEAPRMMVPFEEIRTEEDLLPPGAPEGTVPTDLNQSTGLERLELLGKMQGVDVFDMRPLDASRTGTLDNPIRVKSGGDEQYVGCTGCPADSHHTIWVTVSRGRPLGRCKICGSCYELDYIGPPDDPNAHHDPNEWQEPKTFADYIKPEYRYR